MPNMPEIQEVGRADELTGSEKELKLFLETPGSSLQFCSSLPLLQNTPAAHQEWVTCRLKV